MPSIPSIIEKKQRILRRVHTMPIYAIWLCQMAKSDADSNKYHSLSSNLNRFTLQDLTLIYLLPGLPENLPNVLHL